MAISVTLTVYHDPYGIDQTSNLMYLRGDVTWAAGTYATGGIAPNNPPYSNVSGQKVMIPTLNVQPDTLVMYTISGSGYTYVWNPTGDSPKVQIFVQSGVAGAPLEELPAGSLPTAVVNDAIEFVATWVKQ